MDDFLVQAPISSINSNSDSVKYISSYDIPVHEEAFYDGCSQGDLINKGLLSVGGKGIVTCSHDIRLVTYLEGKVPDYSKEKCSDIFAKDIGRTCAKLSNDLLVSLKLIEFITCL